MFIALSLNGYLCIERITEIMAKEKTVYFCSNCGYESIKWVGKCPMCNQWNTFIENKIVEQKSSNSFSDSQKQKQNLPKLIEEISTSQEERINMHDEELNRVLGGGLVSGSLVLLGGEPGIGKSTLVLQTVLQINDKKILYVSGEESAKQLEFNKLLHRM